MPSYFSNKSIVDMLKAGIRKVASYAEGEEIGSDKIQEAFEAWQLIVSDLENNHGVRIFKVATRQRVFEASSAVIGDDGLKYRCSLTHTVKNIANWVQKTEYAYKDVVYPAVYNGYYYECQNENGGLSGNSQPSLTSMQDAVSTDSQMSETWVTGNVQIAGDIISPSVANGYFFKCINPGTTDATEPDWNQDQVTDNDVVWQRYENIVWKAVPDTKPVTGKNWSTFWVKDDSIADADASAYAVNTTYHCAGDFQVPDDELYTKRANLRYQGIDQEELEIVDIDTFMELRNRGEVGEPRFMCIEYTDINTRVAHLHPTPRFTGADGYILHSEIALRMPFVDDPTASTGFVDRWLRFFPFAIGADLAPEYNIDMPMCIYLDKKAQGLFKQAHKADQPKTTSRRVSSCY